MTLAYLVQLLILGLVVGALARLAVPGRNPMGILMTMLVGVAGAFIGAIVSNAFGLTGLLTYVVAVLCAAAIVYLVSGASRGGWRRRGGLV